MAQSTTDKLLSARLKVERAKKHINPVTTPEEMKRYAEWKEQTEA